jgi:hypothetical protein
MKAVIVWPQSLIYIKPVSFQALQHFQNKDNAFCVVVASFGRKTFNRLTFGQKTFLHRLLST